MNNTWILYNLLCICLINILENAKKIFKGTTHPRPQNFKAHIYKIALKNEMPMDTIEPRSRKVTTKMVIKTLKEHGHTVTRQEAKFILNFMYKIAILSVNQYVKL